MLDYKVQKLSMARGNSWEKVEHDISSELALMMMLSVAKHGYTG